MEFCTEFDDDAYFAHLKRQILMLMMDEDDDFMAISRPPLLQYVQNSPSIGRDDHSTGLQVESCKPPRGESSGTGVFIPCLAPVKTKQGKRGKVTYANRLVSGRIPKAKSKN